MDINTISQEEADLEIWNLGSDCMAEINSYRLTLQEAMDMVEPAVYEDGFMISELYIWREKEIKELR